MTILNPVNVIVLATVVLGVVALIVAAVFGIRGLVRRRRAAAGI
jgi:hypothetical protein